MRLKYIDILKGFNIFLVVLGHIIATNCHLFKIIYSFHVPLFFIISGYLFNFEKYENNFLTFLKNRFLRLLLPYFTMLLLFILFYLCFESPKPFIDTPVSAIVDICKSEAIGFLYGFGIVNPYKVTPIGPLWFLLALFCVEIMFFLSYKITKKWNIMLKSIFYFFISYLGILIGSKMIIPWNLDISLVAIFFVFVGYEFRSFKIIEKFSKQKNEINYIIIIVVLFALWFFTMKNSSLSMDDRIYHNFVYIYISAVSASVILFSLSYKIQDLKFLSVINRLLSYIGMETLIILAVHIRVKSNTPYWSCLRYNDFCFAVYLILFSLMIGLVIKQIPILNKIYYPNINKNKCKDLK